MEYFDNLVFFGQLLLAALLGSLLGIEREIARKTAGMRTFALVSLGSALFSIVSRHALDSVAGQALGFDPTRIAAQIVTGVGFIGGGLMVMSGSRLHGVTTAAGLWLAAAIGMAVGFGFYMVSMFASFVALFIFVFLWQFEERVLKKPRGPSDLDEIA